MALQSFDPYFTDLMDWDLSPWTDWTGMGGLTSGLSNLGGFGTRGQALPGRGWFNPDIDIYDCENEYVVDIELAGTSRDEINLNLNENMLEVSGRKGKKGKGSPKIVERGYGKFRRTIPLPADCKTDQLQAICSDGLLEIRVPKGQRGERETQSSQKNLQSQQQGTQGYQQGGTQGYQQGGTQGCQEGTQDYQQKGQGSQQTSGQCSTAQQQGQSGEAQPEKRRVPIQ